MLKYIENFFLNGLSYRISALYFILALSLIALPTYVRVSELAAIANVNFATFTAQAVIDLVNSSRLAYGMQSLKENRKLAEAASKKAEDMFVNQYFAHFSPQGKSPWDFIRVSGYKYYAAGENLAIDFSTPERTHGAFMDSPTHRANILSPLYAEIGVAVKTGTFNGRPSIIIAQYFGKESGVSATPVAPTPVAHAETQPLPVVNGLAAAATADTGARTIAFLVIISLLVSAALIIKRIGAMSVGGAIRLIILLAMFAYIAFTGTGETIIAKISVYAPFFEGA